MIHVVYFQIVFGYCFLVDDGRAAVKGAGRSCESVHGKGYYRRFLKTSNDYFHSIHPQVSIVKDTAFWSDFRRKAVDLLKRNGTLKTLVKRVSVGTMYNYGGTFYKQSVPSLSKGLSQ